VERSVGIRAFGYWFLAGALILFGLVDLVAIGLPFLVLGLTLIGVGPFRKRPEVFRPAIAAALAFIAVGFLFVPLGCTTRGTAVPSTAVSPGSEAGGLTTCSNALGIDYSGPSPYSPPLLPAFVAGLVGGAVAWLGARAWAHRRIAGGARRTAGT
jgi:hypothetical protein